MAERPARVVRSDGTVRGVRTLERFGPYFAVEPLAVPGPEWLPLPQFLTPASLSAVADRTHASLLTRGPLGRTPADLRAVASTVSLGLFSRLLSPSIGAELVGARTFVPDSGTTLIRQAASGPGDVGTTAPLTQAGPEQVLEEVVLPVAAAFGEQFGVPQQVLRGNLAAAVVGACDVVRSVAPGQAGATAALRARLLTHPAFEGSGNAEGPFVRTSCCLIHRLPVGFVCGNCPLVATGTPTALRLQGQPVRPRR